MADLADLKKNIADMDDEEALEIIRLSRERRIAVRPTKKVTKVSIDKLIDDVPIEQIDGLLESLEAKLEDDKRQQETRRAGSEGVR